MKLDSAIIPCTWYNIESNINNNYFFVIDTSNPTNKIIITIQDGRYNKSNLLEKINDEIMIRHQNQMRHIGNALEGEMNEK